MHLKLTNHKSRHHGLQCKAFLVFWFSFLHNFEDSQTQLFMLIMMYLVFM